MFGSHEPRRGVIVALFAVALLSFPVAGAAEEAWLQLKCDSGHCGNVPDRSVAPSLGLIGAVPLTDAVFTAPVVADGCVYVVDAAGVAFCLDAATLARRSGKSKHAAARPTAATSRRRPSRDVTCTSALPQARTTCWNGKAEQLSGRCGGAILSSARLSWATTGSILPPSALAFTPSSLTAPSAGRGTLSRSNWDSTAIVGAGRTGSNTRRSASTSTTSSAVRGTWLCTEKRSSCLPDPGWCGWKTATTMRRFRPRTVVARDESYRVATMGLSIGEDGAVYRQTHRIDNGGEVERLRLRDGKVQVDRVPGTETAANLPGSLSFSSVSVRGSDVYRCRPEEGFGFCKHVPGQAPVQYAGSYPSIAAPILLRDMAVYGGLDGRLYVVPLSGGPVWSFQTAFGKAISAPAAVCDGRIYFGCEDGYLYVLGPRRQCTVAVEGSEAVGDSQPTGNEVHRPALRLVYQLWPLGQHERQRPGVRASVEDEVDSSVRRHGQAVLHLWRRPDVYAHRRGPDLRRRAGHGPVVVAAVLSWSPHFLHDAALLQRAVVDPASRV